MKKMYAPLLLLMGTASALAQITIPITNSGTTGTTLNETAIVNSSANAVLAGTSNTGVPTYIVVGGAGTTGQSTIAVAGPANCFMDSTIASAAGWYFVVNSTTTPGECHAQSATPSAGTWVIGYLESASTTSGQVALVHVSSYVYGGSATGAYLQISNNLSDLNSASSARTNLGLGSAALLNSTAVLQSANNLSDLGSASAARTNLGLGAIATQAGPLFPVNAQNSTYQVLAADFAACKTIPVASGTFTITLVASGSQPATGQCIDVINYGSGVVTIARSGQSINGATSNLTLAAASATAPTGAHIVSDGSNYEAAVFGAASSTATNLSGTGVDSAPYQSSSATTGYITAPTTNAHTYVYAWQPTGSAVAPGALDVTNIFAGIFPTSVSAGVTPPTACGSATGCWAASEGSTAGTPTTGQDYIHADSPTHTLKTSINGGTEVVLSNGLASWHLVQAPTSLTAQAASISATTVYTTPAMAGYYRVCATESTTRVATSSSTLPQIGASYTNANDSNVKNAYVTALTSTSNNVGSAQGGCLGPIYAAASSAIQYATYGYASSGATAMQYDLQVTVEVLE